MRIGTRRSVYISMMSGNLANCSRTYCSADPSVKISWRREGFWESQDWMSLERSWSMPLGPAFCQSLEGKGCRDSLVVGVYGR